MQAILNTNDGQDFSYSLSRTLKNGIIYKQLASIVGIEALEDQLNVVCNYYSNVPHMVPMYAEIKLPKETFISSKVDMADLEKSLSQVFTTKFENNGRIPPAFKLTHMFKTCNISIFNVVKDALKDKSLKDSAIRDLGYKLMLGSNTISFIEAKTYDDCLDIFHHGSSSCMRASKAPAKASTKELPANYILPEGYIYRVNSLIQYKLHPSLWYMHCPEIRVVGIKINDKISGRILLKKYKDKLYYNILSVITEYVTIKPVLSELITAELNATQSINEELKFTTEFSVPIFEVPRKDKVLRVSPLAFFDYYMKDLSYKIGKDEVMYGPNIVDGIKLTNMYLPHNGFILCP